MNSKIFLVDLLICWVFIYITQSNYVLMLRTYAYTNILIEIFDVSKILIKMSCQYVGTIVSCS